MLEVAQSSSLADLHKSLIIINKKPGGRAAPGLGNTI